MEPIGFCVSIMPDVLTFIIGFIVGIIIAFIIGMWGFNEL